MSKTLQVGTKQEKHIYADRKSLGKYAKILAHRIKHGPRGWKWHLNSLTPLQKTKLHWS